MMTETAPHEVPHLLRESAEYLIEPPWAELASLLFLASRSLVDSLDLPAPPMTAHLGSSKCRI